MRVRKQLPVEHEVFQMDNLKFLTEYGASYEGTVDFVYLDPGMNVGKSSRASAQVNHARWAAFMHPRVQQTLPLMKRTGIIAFTVDDSEMVRARSLLDEEIGEENFIGMVVVDSGNVHNNAKFLSINHEYLLVYAKDLKHLNNSHVRWRQAREGLDAVRKKERSLRAKHKDDYLTITEEMKAWMKVQSFHKRMKLFFNADARGLYTYADLSAPGMKLTYDVFHPVTGRKVELPGRGWGLTKDNFENLVAEDMIIWGDDETSQPLRKLYLKDTPDQVLRGVWHHPSRNTSSVLKKILGGSGFEDPVSLDFMKYLIDVMTPKDAVILDYFAGSGTTGHAVLDLNYEDVHSLRRFILVNNNEKHMFTKVLRPRLEAVITGQWADGHHRPRKAALTVY